MKLSVSAHQALLLLYYVTCTVMAMPPSLPEQTCRIGSSGELSVLLQLRVHVNGTRDIVNISATEELKPKAEQEPSLKPSFKSARVVPALNLTEMLEPASKHLGLSTYSLMGCGVLVVLGFAAHIHGLRLPPQSPDVDQHWDESRSGNSAAEASLKLASLLCGSGLLHVPYCCAASGWISLPIIVIVSCCVAFFGNLLIECVEELQTHRQEGNSEAPVDYYVIARAAIGTGWGARVNSFILASEFMLCAVAYGALMVANLGEIFPDFEQWKVALIAGLFLVGLMLSGLSQSWWFSSATTFGSIICFIISAVYTRTHPKVLPRRWGLIGELNNVLMTFYVMVFAYGNLPAVCDLYSTCTEKKKFGCGYGVSLAAVLYLLVGIVSISCLGIKASDPFTRNIGREGDGSSLSVLMILRLVSAAAWCYTLSNIMPHLFQPALLALTTNSKRRRAGKYSLALIIPFLTLCTGGHFAELSAIVGGLGTILTLGVLPTLFYSALCYRDLNYLEKTRLALCLSACGVAAGLCSAWHMVKIIGK